MELLTERAARDISPGLEEAREKRFSVSDIRERKSPDSEARGSEVVNHEYKDEPSTTRTIPLPPVLIPERVRESRVFRRGHSFSCWRWRREFCSSRIRLRHIPATTGGRDSVQHRWRQMPCSQLHNSSRSPSIVQTVSPSGAFQATKFLPVLGQRQK